MKIVTIVLSLLALAMIGYNLTKVNLEVPFEGESVVALITIIASLCVLAMLQILRLSKRVEQHLKTNN